MESPNACSLGEDEQGLPMCLTWLLTEILIGVSPAQPSPALHRSDKSPGEQVTSSVVLKVLLALGYHQPMKDFCL